MSTTPSEKEVVAQLAAAIAKSMASNDRPMVRYDREDDSIAIDVPAIVRAVRAIESGVTYE